MKRTAALAIGLCLIASTGHAQGWVAFLNGFLQGDQQHYLQQQNMQHGYPAQIYQPYAYGGQPQPSYFFFNGRTITCIPMGNGSTYCQ